MSIIEKNTNNNEPEKYKYATIPGNITILLFLVKDLSSLIFLNRKFFS